MLEYYRVFAKQIKLLPPEPKLSDFFHPSEVQKNSELLFVVVGTGVATYALTDEEKLYQAYYEPDRLWTGGKAIKELHKITSMSISNQRYQIMVSQASSLASSYTTSKRNQDIKSPGPLGLKNQEKLHLC